MTIRMMLMRLLPSYHEAKEREELAALPEDLQPYAEGVFALIDSVFSDAALPKIDNGRAPKTNPLNDNFHRAEFQELWGRINKKAVYTVEFETSELVGKCVAALNTQLRVTPLFYKVETGTQIETSLLMKFEAARLFKHRQTRPSAAAVLTLL